MKSKGFTLAEIPIALLVLAVIFVLVTRTFSTAGRVQKGSQLGNQATAFAAAKLDELQAYPLSHVADGQDQVTSANGATFTRSWTVTQPIPSSLAKSVEVRVDWSVAGKTETLTLASLLR